jgi:hypothetical protein
MCCNGFLNQMMVVICSTDYEHYRQRKIAFSGGGDRTIIEHPIGRIDYILSNKALIMYTLNFYPFPFLCSIIVWSAIRQP